MERFWNIVYYFAYRVEYKFTYYFFKCTGIFKLYSLPFVKKRFEKINIKDPVADLKNNLKRHDGLGNTSAGALMSLLPCVLFFGLHSLYIAYVAKPKSFGGFMVVFIAYVIPSFVFSHILLFRKDKYLKYFKEFENKPRKWKIKWAWISLGVILFPFIVLVSSFIVNSSL